MTNGDDGYDRLLRRKLLAMTKQDCLTTLAMTYRGQLPRPLRTNAKCITYNYNVELKINTISRKATHSYMFFVLRFELP